MKNSLYLILFILVSCAEETEKKDETIIKTSSEYIKSSVERNTNTKLDLFFNSFLRRHSNMCNNEILEKEAKKAFIKELREEIKNGLLSDLPLELLSCEREEFKYDKNYGKNVAKFKGQIVGRDSVYVINLYVESILSDSVARATKKHNSYLPEGNFVWTKSILNTDVNYVWPLCNKEYTEILIQDIHLKTNALNSVN